MKNTKGQPNNPSYESDGKMGKNRNSLDNKKEKKDFFNVTQDSE